MAGESDNPSRENHSKVSNGNWELGIDNGPGAEGLTALAFSNLCIIYEFDGFIVEGSLA